MKRKVIVGISGGVDSSAALYLLKNGGDDVIGVTLKLFEKEDLVLDQNNACVTSDDLNDAILLCKNLDVEHRILDFGKTFEENVIDYFISSYKKGETPNPCVVCNRTVKFKTLFDEAKRENGFISTGHYANIGFENGRYYIKKGKDETKDQSYVLWGLSQELLSRLIFPLGNFSKDEIRSLAEKAGIHTARKKDSQDICFIPNGNYLSFIEKRCGKEEVGNFISLDGKILGEHKGISGYTIGQRRGLGISSTEPYYVVSKNTAENAVILGRESDLYSRRFTVRETNFMPFESLKSDIRLKVKTRYKQKEQIATLSPINENTVEVVFDEEIRAVTSGQSAVFYDDDILVGGGIIN